MKKLLLVACMLIQCSATFAQLSKRMAQDTLVWRSDSMLIKEDFKAKRGGSNEGLTASTFIIYPKEKNGTMIFTVEAIFLKSKSYLKEDSPYIIKHEQLHFDICELYARKLRQLIAEKDFKKVKKIVEEIQRMYNKTFADCQREETKYDNDTEHSMNAAKQKVWNDLVAQQLKDLEKYASTEVNIVK